MPDVVEEAEELIDRADVRLISLMDHTPGQRQFRDEDKLRDYYRGKNGGLTDAELDVLFATRLDYQQRRMPPTNMRAHRRARAASTTMPLASHDDTTAEHVAEAVRDGVAVAEFPTTVEAARGLHEAGIGMLMGAPNVVRGGSHSGNVAADRSGARGPARHPVVRLRAVEPADGGAAAAASGCPAIDLAAGGAHGHQDAGRGGRPRRSRRDRRRQARRSDPRACRRATCRSCARSGARGSASHDEALTSGQRNDRARGGSSSSSGRAAPARTR